MRRTTVHPSIAERGQEVTSEPVSSQASDSAAIKARQQAVWAAGDYQEIGARVLLASELLCEAVGIQAGQRVLDVASGTGNAALAAARRFAFVTSTDYVPELLERGRLRAHAEGLPMTFEVADAESLAFPDDSFDVVLSAFGAMFAPNQEQVASELLRVCKPGGKIGMTNWTPDGFVGEQHRSLASHLPPPPELKSPMLWGSEKHLRELFGGGISGMRIQRREAEFRYHSIQQYIGFMRSYFGPFQSVFEALDAVGQESLAAELMEQAARYNRSGNETVLAPGEYLEVVAVKA
jgi:ubiquinone/menaquinone biosynthesis C-methylase UbiE